ncbi:hypothetical protein [Hymenobacter pini]|uniref:hypothetical protein n=1 Tax=Hymenobacter pini TaxID=2880879 RepID=UPI001CF5687E|nr:hypothetical protein [Hymenobacter pini]
MEPQFPSPGLSKGRRVAAMESLKSIDSLSPGRTLTADDLIEFHASRLLLLVLLCGIQSRPEGTYRIDGLTKLAKLDFFVRYPEFFQRAAAHFNTQVSADEAAPESKMIRFHYGPWDKRYYQVLPYLEARGLLKVAKTGNAYTFSLTPKGTAIGKQLSADPSFSGLAARMRDVKRVLGNRSGSSLKDLVYYLFDQEVGAQQLNSTIQQS